MTVRVEEAAFEIGHELSRLKAAAAARGLGEIGAFVTFTGTVRGDDGTSDGRAPIVAMTLEHYPGMTEAELARVEAAACARWPLSASLVVHRHGRLLPGDDIVLVITASRHRDAAFDAARFLMDFLKTSAPFWKRIERADGTSEWVEAKAADDLALARWTAAGKEDGSPG
ncbi:MAG: molybdenum cofactor biosynthesis protein MoaE [Hyphomicrobiaceae bacterium]